MQRNWIIIIVIFSLMNISAHAQDDSIRMDIRVQARKYFSEKDYVKALPLYRELLNSFPKEPEYQFCTATCIINLNMDMDEAISLLKSTNVSEYSPLASFYLGRALHLNYAFEDAIKAYSRYILKSKGSEPGIDYVERQIEMARNGLNYTRSGKILHVQNIELIPVENLQYAAAINGSGKLMRKPIEFCSKTDKRYGYRPWMFLPAYTEINEYVYVAGYEASKKNGKQLYRVRNVKDETWGIPELLDEMINTQYDEEYPFFDTRTSTLYFSSTGHSSMGGYDIFSSVYNWNTKSWSHPENLGFPINSPYDDFIYITDGFGSTVSFLSKRTSRPGQATIYRLKLLKDTAAVRYNSADEIRKASLLQNFEEKDNLPSALITQIKQDTQQIPPVKPDISQYNIVLADAMYLQLRADSAARITRDLRIMARESNEDSIKKEIVEEILKNDRLAKTLQRQADSKFTKARELRHEPEQDTLVSSVVPAKEVNGIRIYRYTSDQENAHGFKTINEAELAEEKMKPVEEVKKPINMPYTDQFSILDGTPYSELNPIPYGLSQDTGLVYRVQLGVYSKIQPHNSFGGINPVVYEQVSGTSMLKYFAGRFHRLNGVTKALERIRALGHPDAFVVAFYNGKPITTEKAKEIEFADFKL